MLTLLTAWYMSNSKWDFGLRWCNLVLVPFTITYLHWGESKSHLELYVYDALSNVYLLCIEIGMKKIYRIHIIYMSCLGNSFHNRLHWCIDIVKKQQNWFLMECGVFHTWYKVFCRRDTHTNIVEYNFNIWFNFKYLI
jgi:hypothetical protein